jgi:hypothetical protein
MQKAELGGSQFKASQGKSVRPYLKQTKSKKIGGMTQVVECLPNKSVSLLSNTVKLINK